MSLHSGRCGLQLWWDVPTPIGDGVALCTTDAWAARINKNTHIIDLLVQVFTIQIV